MLPEWGLASGDELGRLFQQCVALSRLPLICLVFFFFFPSHFLTKKKAVFLA